MNPPSDPPGAVKVSPPKICEPPRKLFTGGEWLTLIGMVLAVMSAAFPWQRFVPRPAEIAGAIFVSRSARLVPGFEVKIGPLNVGWAVVAAAVACGALLLFSPEHRERKPYLVIQTTLGLLILGLAAYQGGLFAGIYMAIAGAALLLAGGVLRFR